MTTKRTQQQRREQTQHQVLESATYLFAKRGYQDAGLEEIAEHSGLTIRPIYHYYGSKKALFTAVVEHLEQQLADQLQLFLENTPHDLNAGWQAFMLQAESKAFRQIVLIDAPNVLGRERWSNSAVVELAQQALTPYLPDSPTHTLLMSRMLLVALAEVALVLAENNSDEFIQAANEVVSGLLAQINTKRP